MTLKSRLRVTQGMEPLDRSYSIIHDIVIVELFDVEYYCDLEMWVRSLKIIESGTI